MPISGIAVNKFHIRCVPLLPFIFGYIPACRHFQRTCQYSQMAGPLCRWDTLFSQCKKTIEKFNFMNKRRLLPFWLKKKPFWTMFLKKKVKEEERIFSLFYNFKKYLCPFDTVTEFRGEIASMKNWLKNGQTMLSLKYDKILFSCVKKTNCS